MYILIYDILSSLNQLQLGLYQEKVHTFEPGFQIQGVNLTNNDHSMQIFDKMDVYICGCLVQWFGTVNHSQFGIRRSHVKIQVATWLLHLQSSYTTNDGSNMP